MTKLAMAALLSGGLLFAVPVRAADAGIPARIRVLKGARQGPPEVAPSLKDLGHQLSHTAYLRWEQAGELQMTMGFLKPVVVALPDGVQVVVTLIESRRDTATYEVRVPSLRTHSRLTISKDKRIVHQVTPEKGGEAYFVTIRPWP